MKNSRGGTWHRYCVKSTDQQQLHNLASKICKFLKVKIRQNQPGFSQHIAFMIITVRNSSCGKVMFLHLSVILFRGGVHDKGACMAGGSMRGRVGVHGRGGACIAGGHVCVAGETATAADSWRQILAQFDKLTVLWGIVWHKTSTASCGWADRA